MSRTVVTATAQAERDIVDIAAYIAVETLERIAEFPSLGHRLPGVRGPILGVRISQRFRKYVIF